MADPLVERRGDAEIALRKVTKYGVPGVAKDGGHRSDWGRGAAGFWNKVRKDGESPGGCWVWTGYTDPDGYGKFSSTRLRADGKPASGRPHRLVWEWEHGLIPRGLVVMHMCDNPACVNIEHLRLGTQADNVHDCYAKGRHENRNDTRGEMSGRATLRDAEVLFIRAQERVYGLAPVLARLFGVKVQVIHQVLARRTWKHIGRGNITTRMPLRMLRQLAAQREGADRLEAQLRLEHEAVSRRGDAA